MRVKWSAWSSSRYSNNPSSNPAEENFFVRWIIWKKTKKRPGMAHLKWQLYKLWLYGRIYNIDHSSRMAGIRIRIGRVKLQSMPSGGWRLMNLRGNDKANFTLPVPCSLSLSLSLVLTCTHILFIDVTSNGTHPN